MASSFNPLQTNGSSHEVLTKFDTVKLGWSIIYIKGPRVIM